MIKVSIFEIRKNPFAILAVLFFIVLSLWWVTIFYRGLTEGAENNAFTLIYPMLSLFGGIVGLAIARQWGGFKSFLGSSISLLLYRIQSPPKPSKKIFFDGKTVVFKGSVNPGSKSLSKCPLCSPKPVNFVNYFTHFSTLQHTLRLLHSNPNGAKKLIF